MKLENVRGGVNRLIVKLNAFNDSVKFSDGTELWIDSKYEPANHTQVIGTVQAVPSRMYFNKRDSGNSMEWKTEMELQKGDTVYMEYFAVMMALADKYDQAASYPQPTWFEIDGALYISIPYAYVYFAIRNDKVLPVNGYCIATPINVDVVKSDTIYIPTEQANKTSGRWAQLIHVGKANTAFMDKNHRDVGELSPGDVVMFNSYANQRIEYSLHKTLFDKDKEYVVIQRRWMKAMLPAKYKKDVESGALK